jgi:hypothetical protein
MRITLLALAALTVAFAATWIQMPRSYDEAVKPPASLFAGGLTWRDGTVPGYPDHVDLGALERRVKYGFGSAALVVVLVGVAFGAVPRRRTLSTERA